jgi:hypothetical protein
LELFWELVRYNTGHFENHDMRARVLRFLDRFLVGMPQEPSPTG